MSKNLADLRFVIHAQDIGHSSPWRLWMTPKGDIYLASSGMAGIAKVSFHQSGIARYAFTKQQASARNDENRLMHRWMEPTVPARNTGQFARLAWLAFPTDYLSRNPSEGKAKTARIPPAEPGRATLVEIGLTRDIEATVALGTQAITAAGLLLYSPIRRQTSAFVRWQHSDWQNSDLRMPSSHGLKAYRFLANEPYHPERPFRIITKNHPTDGEALLITELGGCQDAA